MNLAEFMKEIWGNKNQDYTDAVLEYFRGVGEITNEHEASCFEISCAFAEAIAILLLSNESALKENGGTPIDAEAMSVATVRMAGVLLNQARDGTAPTQH